ILLLDSTSIQLQNGEPVGEARMLVGLGRRAIIHGNVGAVGHDGARREEKQLVFEITRLEIREVPPEHDPVIDHGEMKNPEEVIRLRAGVIIELRRSPADPVDLVVAGKLLAKGELVEIEGQLGVKILNLVKDVS